MILYISSKEKMLFARNMAVMSRAGMQILAILKALKDQTKSSNMKEIFTHLIKEVKNGSALYTALQKYEKFFGGFFINLLKIGELSGSLADNLDYLAEALDKQQTLKSKARGAMIYPIIILIATVGMMLGMIFFIFPKILPVFESLKVDLPLSTRVFIGIATFLIDNGIPFVVGLFGLSIGLWLILKVKPIRYAWEWFLLRVPVLNTMIVDFNIVYVARTMSLLLKGGTKIVEAIKVTSSTVENPVYKKKLEKIAANVGSGDTISIHLIKSPRLFPSVFAQMIGVGEKTGKLSETGIYLADFYDKELDNSTKSVTNLLEPLLLLVMGLAVAFVAISIITPIYSVTENF
ncbi:MAG: type II secretion system F family protein [Parcubacteria group bacterium]